METATMRDVIERLVRPGQRGTSVTANRDVRREATGSGGGSFLVRADEGEVHRAALYGRGRYSGTSYAAG